jgi:hypothetical protein
MVSRQHRIKHSVFRHAYSVYVKVVNPNVNTIHTYYSAGVFSAAMCSAYTQVPEYFKCSIKGSSFDSHSWILMPLKKHLTAFIQPRTIIIYILINVHVAELINH